MLYFEDLYSSICSQVDKTTAVNRQTQNSCQVPSKASPLYMYCYTIPNSYVLKKMSNLLMSTNSSNFI